jgi:hypothetical protein
MEEQNIFTELKENIENYFAFLKDYGFSDFERTQFFLKTQYETKNNFVTICFESRGYGTLVTVKIDQYGIQTLEPDNPVLEEISARHNEIYDALFRQFNKPGKDTSSPEIILETKVLVEKYVEELSNIIKRHKSVLTGDKELFERNRNVFTQRNEIEKSAERIKNKIYTLEYHSFLFNGESDNDYDGYHEFTTLEDIKRFLSENEDIKHIEYLTGI